ncbi:MAG TPA: hypothetical protein VGF40_14630 [Thermoanaerobaculia bacterium]
MAARLDGLAGSAISNLNAHFDFAADGSPVVSIDCLACGAKVITHPAPKVDGHRMEWYAVPCPSCGKTARDFGYEPRR